MQMRFALCALAILAVAACGKPASEAEPTSGAAAGPVAEADEPASPDAAGGDTQEDLCGAADHQSLVGSNVAAITLPADLNHRVIGPNDVVTMEFNSERLNIYTDENGVVTEVKCG